MVALQVLKIMIQEIIFFALVLMFLHLAGSLGKLVNEKEEMMVEYLEKLKNLPEVNIMYKKLLKQR